METSFRIVVKTCSRILFIIYILLLGYFLFFSEHYGRTIINEDYRYNLTLFKEVRRFITYREIIGLEYFIVNIIGNILAFTPFGFFLPILSPENRRFFHITFLSFEFSLTVELLQLLFKVGIFDVDDLLMNTMGGVIGYLGFYICFRIYQFFRKH